MTKILNKILCLFLTIALPASLVPVNIVLASPITITVSGTAVFNYRENVGVTTDTREPLGDFPITIQLNYLTRWGFDDHVNFSAETLSDGSFNETITLPSNSSTPPNYQVRIIIHADDGLSCYVVDKGILGAYVDGFDNRFRAFHATRFQRTDNNGNINFGEIIAEPAGAFNIVKNIREGYDFLVAEGITPPRRIPIVWGPAVLGVGAMYNFYEGFIFLPDNDGNMNHYDRALHLHEYGHAVMVNAISNNDGIVWNKWSVNDFNLDTRHAFNDGWATYFTQFVMGTPIDTQYIPGGGTHSIRNLESPHLSGSNFTNAMNASSAEYSIKNAIFNAAAMWSITDGINLAKIDPWDTSTIWEDRVDRSFPELFRVMAHTMNNSGSSKFNPPALPFLGNTTVSDADISHFYNNYFDLGHIPPNSLSARDFWRVFNHNGMQFDSTPPTVTLNPIVLNSSGTSINVRGTATDNIWIERIELFLNGNDLSLIPNRMGNNFSFDVDVSLLNPRINIFTVRAYDYAGEVAIVRGATSPMPWLPFMQMSTQVNNYANTFSPASNQHNSLQVEMETIRRPAYGRDVGFYYHDVPVNTQRIAVIPGWYDDVGAVLSSMGISFDTLTAADLSNHDILKQYDAVFVNCETSTSSEAIRQYVQGGGLLYASDWSGVGLMQSFPGLLDFGVISNAQRINTNVVDTGLATDLGSNSLQVTFNLNNWIVTTQLPQDATVYVQSNGLFHNGFFQPHFIFPLSYSFRYGDGRVFYTSFHNNAQATNDMIRFLEYLIFNIEYSQNEDNLIKMAETNGYDFLGAVFAKLKSGETSEFYSFTPNPGQDFKLMLDSSMGNFTIKLKDPMGRIYFGGKYGILTHTEPSFGAFSLQTTAFDPFVQTQNDMPMLLDSDTENCNHGQCNHDIQLDEIEFELNEFTALAPAVAFNTFNVNQFDGFYGLDTRVVSLGHQGLIVTDPMPGEWQFAITSNNSVDNVTVAVGIVEKPQAPLITNEYEVSSLQTGDGASLRGIASVNGYIQWTLSDSTQKLTEGSVVTGAGNDFIINLPNMLNGYYTMYLWAVDENGFESRTTSVRIIVCDAIPEITVDERYETFIFGDNVSFITAASNTAVAWISLNGEMVESQVLPGSQGESLSVALFADLNLEEGINEVIITAVSTSGITSEKTIFITSDQLTPDEFRTAPVISEISIEQSTEIGEFTTVTVMVDDSNPNDVALSVANNSVPVNVTSFGNGLFEFTIDPSQYDNGSRSIRITAENKWGNFDQVSRQIIIIDESPVTPTPTPTPTPAPIGQTIYDMQADTRLPEIATTSIPFLNRVHGTATTFSVNMNSDPRTVTVNARTGTSQGIRFNMRDVNDIVKQNHEYRLEATGRLINPAETSMARFRIESPPSGIDPVLALAALSPDGSFKLSHTLTQEEIWVLRNSAISIGNTGGSYNIVYTGILIIEICIDCCEICGRGDCECCKCTVLCLDCGKCLDCDCTCEDVILPAGNVIYNMQADTRLHEIATRSIPFLNRIHGSGTTFTVNMESDPRTVTVNARTGTSQGIRFNLSDVNAVAKPGHEYRLEATGRLINPAGTSMARFRIESPPSGVEPVLVLAQLRADGSFSLTHTLTQEEVWALRNSSISIGNTGGSYDIVYTGIIISEICIDCCEICGCDDCNCGTIINHTVNYVVTNSWGNNQTVEITITNTSNELIRNWALQYDFNGTITNIWNGRLHSENIVRSEMYNSDIAPGASVTFGYTLTNATGEVPDNFILTSFRVARENGYAVDLNVLHDWGSGFTGTITITNTADTPIMAWELSFDTNFTITDPGNFVILASSGNSYKITGTFNGNIPIPVNTSIVLQFNGVQTENHPKLSNVSLTEMVIP